MNKVRSMLQDLLLWVQLQSTDLDYYLTNYPYIQYRQIDTANLLKLKVNDTIEFIVALITQKEIRNTRKRDNQHRDVVSVEEENLLFKVKGNLEQIRFSFLVTRELQTITTARILTLIKNSIDLTTSGSGKPNNDTHNIRSKNHSQYLFSNPQRLNPRYLQRPSRGDGNNLDLSSRTAKVKRELYHQMDTYLRVRQKRLSQDKYLNLLDGKQGESIEEKKRKYSFDKVLAKKGEESLGEKKGTGKKNKKKFAYLEEYQRSIAKLGQEAGKEEAILEKRYESPKEKESYEHNYKSQPSTEPQSTPHNLKLADLEAELPQFQDNPDDLQSLKKQIDFGPKLSKIKQKQLQFQEPWQIFQEDDIIQKQGQHLENLQDSLEMMKQKQKLNETGTFKVPLNLVRDYQEYSFGQE